ncbi:polysaccharide deacetylase family protein [Bailinhaonella thermotolerans]|uniref:Xylanase n=1 Tax=Bailinhaonella thermotolerans TaxID=1070861 RepID=A0A3A4A3H2_9ACTN|nr:polysaccharide deacetylase family protein [Bailinhaonella thermotolerans]RJL22134.1 xylanase [Bailinhaonella thermotolerans]
MKSRIAAAAGLAAAVALTGACGSGAPKEAERAAARAPAPAPPPKADPAKVKANELGLVPVLMYHQIIDKPTTVYDRTPADFRAELERLAREGYVPVTAGEYATGRIDIPAGKHPVVLTFDDSTTSQFALRADGQVEPKTAVGILMDVARRNPGFRPKATMFVNGNPFNLGARGLQWLHKNGFEVGNHTLTHANLATASAAGVQKEIAANQKQIQDALPGTQVTTLALPFGIKPRPERLAQQGTSAAGSYSHKGVFLVGSNPAVSPHSSSYDPANIPRIRSQGKKGPEANFGSFVWLTRLSKTPENLYTSDGDPKRISYPKTSTEQLAGPYRGLGNAY